MNYSGKLLIASPSLTDPNFRRTVVFLVQDNDDDGVIGLILNHISNSPIREIWKPVFHQDCATDSLLHFGGPVFTSLTALHTNEKFNDLEVISGVYFTSVQKDLKQLVKDENYDFRFFVGNAGWSKGQLLREISEGIWYLAEATRELVFSETPELWRSLIESIGQDILSEMLHTDKFPDDPTVN